MLFGLDKLFKKPTKSNEPILKQSSNSEESKIINTLDNINDFPGVFGIYYATDYDLFDTKYGLMAISSKLGIIPVYSISSQYRNGISDSLLPLAREIASTYVGFYRNYLEVLGVRYGKDELLNMFESGDSVNRVIIDIRNAILPIYTHLNDSLNIHYKTDNDDTSTRLSKLKIKYNIQQYLDILTDLETAINNDDYITYRYYIGEVYMLALLLVWVSDKHPKVLIHRCNRTSTRLKCKIIKYMDGLTKSNEHDDTVKTMYEIFDDLLSKEEKVIDIFSGKIYDRKPDYDYNEAGRSERRNRNEQK